MQISSTLFALVVFIANAAAAELIETKYFSIHHALNRADLMRFQSAVVEKIDSFVEYWVQNGFAVDKEKKVSIYVQPSTNINGMDALQKLYGYGILSDARAMEHDITNGDEVGLSEKLRSFLVKYPPFFEPNDFANISFLSGKRFTSEFKNYRSNRKPYRLLDDDANYLHLEEISNGKPNVIIVGGSSDLAMKQHPYLMTDMVLHEIAHSLIRTTIDRGSGHIGAASSLTVNALAADLMTAIYLNDPCLVKNNDGTCTRDLSQQQGNLSGRLWLETEAKLRNAPAAHFFWHLHKAMGREQFAPLLVQALLSATAEFPLFGNNYTSFQLAKDYLLSLVINFQNDIQLVTNMAEQLCELAHSEEAESLCNTFTTSGIGMDDDSAYADSVYQNSPVVMNEKPRELVVGDEPITLWFTNVGDDNKTLSAHIKNGDRVTSFECQNRSSVNIRDHRLVCHETKGITGLIWRGDGQLRITYAGEYDPNF